MNATRPDLDRRVTSHAPRRGGRYGKLLLAGIALAAAAAFVTAIAPTAFGADDPVVAFTTSGTSGVAPFDVQFAGTSSDDPLTWTWDLGDGSSGSTQALTHAYTAAGTFLVILTVTFADHPPIVVTGTDPIVVSPAPPPIPAAPTAALRITGLVHLAGRPVAFSDISTGAPTSRTWTFGDGGTSTLAQPTHAYAAKGTYTVLLTSMNAGGVNVAMTRVAILPTWSGGVQLYQGGIFSMQASMRWCVAASSQMMRNMVTGERDHSAASQGAYFAYGRAHNGYPTPAADGIDPAGWQAVLRRYVDPGYHIVSSASYTAAVRAAATAIRLTGRPVGVFVGFGAHAWVISGFTATADPATSSTFTVTSVNVEGPLWGHPTVNGFDQVPNTRLSAARFRWFLTPYRDPYEPHGWRNRYVILAP